MFNSSQIPLTALFARSMEGPTPISALGYAGLSAHVGVVLLASTADLWLQFDEARMGLATIGASTAIYSGIVSRSMLTERVHWPTPHLARLAQSTS